MHVPVMLHEVLEGLDIRPGGVYIDGTAGGGGHAEAMAEAAGPAGRLLALDRDPDAVDRVRQRLAGFGPRCVVRHADFAALASVAAGEGFASVDGILMDLGLSSYQLEDGQRGFSFEKEGPLDMRMDPSRGESAADLVNGANEKDLADVLFTLGEERRARRIARAIVNERASAPVRTTTQLADIVCRAKGRRGGRIHPATLTFQAIRMAVNGELQSLENGLAAALRTVRPGGRIAVISFHSLEDRIVKHTFRAHIGRRVSLPQGGDEWIGKLPAATAVTRKPARPSEAEIRANPRARSARLRIVQRGEAS